MCVVEEPWAGVKPLFYPFPGVTVDLSLNLSEPQFSYLEQKWIISNFTKFPWCSGEMIDGTVLCRYDFGHGRGRGKEGRAPHVPACCRCGENAKHFKLSQATGSGRFAEKGGGADPM